MKLERYETKSIPDITIDGKEIHLADSKILVSDKNGLTSQEMLALETSIQYFFTILKTFKNHKKWSLEKYTIYIGDYPEYNYYEFSFCPKTETFVAGIPFEIADQGIYKNGPGITMFISKEDNSLLRHYFMR